MNRRKFLGAAAMMAAAVPGSRMGAAVGGLKDSCGCDPFLGQARDGSYAVNPNGQTLASDAFRDVSSGIKITNLKVFGVSLTPNSDRPYVFVKLETNQGIVGWGEGTLEGKAGSAMACIQDFRDFLIGNDPMQVEHLWQSMYVHTFYRAGPLIGHRSGAVGYSRESLERACLSAPRRPLRCSRDTGLLPCGTHTHGGRSGAAA